MFTGFFTIAEAAAVGAFSGIIVMIINRRFTWNNFKIAMIKSIKTTGLVFLILIGADVFGKFLA